MNTKPMSISEIAKLAGTPKTTIRYWSDRVWFPRPEGVSPSGVKLYPRDFGKRLAEFTKENHSVVHARLCCLEWNVVHGDDGVRRQALDELRSLQKEGVLCTTIEAERILVDHRAKTTVRTWIKVGFLAAIKVNRHIFILRSDVDKMRTVLGGLTTDEASSILGVDGKSVWYAVQKGKLTGIMIPHFGLRFEHQEVLRYKAERDERIAQSSSWRSTRVLEELNVHHVTLQNWGDRGILSFTVQPTGKRLDRQYDPQEVLALKKQLLAVKEGFGWLILKSFDETCTTHAASRRLGIGENALLSWAKKDLIPYCRTSPVQLGVGSGSFCYVTKYVDGLRRYAGNKPVSAAIAGEYKKLCGEARHIV